MLFLIAGSFVFPLFHFFRHRSTSTLRNEINETIHSLHFSEALPPLLLTPSNNKEGKELDHTLMPRLIMLHRASKLSLELARNCIIQPYLNGPPLPSQSSGIYLLAKSSRDPIVQPRVQVCGVLQSELIIVDGLVSGVRHKLHKLHILSSLCPTGREPGNKRGQRQCHLCPGPSPPRPPSHQCVSRRLSKQVGDRSSKLPHSAEAAGLSGVERRK